MSHEFSDETISMSEIRPLAARLLGNYIKAQAEHDAELTAIDTPPIERGQVAPEKFQPELAEQHRSQFNRQDKANKSGT